MLLKNAIPAVYEGTTGIFLDRDFERKQLFNLIRINSWPRFQGAGIPEAHGFKVYLYDIGLSLPV